MNRIKEKGQSLLDVIFSVAVVVLILTGLVVLAVNTAKVKRMVFERQKAVELSQKLIEVELQNIKTLTFNSWSKTNVTNKSADSLGFVDYKYDINYGCTINGNANDFCNVIFKVNWGVGQSLSVQRMFSRKGL